MTLRCDEISITIVFSHTMLSNFIMMDNHSKTVGGSTVSLLVFILHIDNKDILALVFGSQLGVDSYNVDHIGLRDLPPFVTVC